MTVRHPGAFVLRYLDKLLKSSSSVNKCDSVTTPRSVMCWVSTTSKSRCLRAPWAHIPIFSTMSKMIWKEITSCSLPSVSFLFVKSSPSPHHSLWNPLTHLARFPEPTPSFIKKGEYWPGVIGSELPQNMSLLTYSSCRRNLWSTEHEEDQKSLHIQFLPPGYKRQEVEKSHLPEYCVFDKTRLAPCW